MNANNVAKLLETMYWKARKQLRSTKYDFTWCNAKAFFNSFRRKSFSRSQVSRLLNCVKSGNSLTSRWTAVSVWKSSWRPCTWWCCAGTVLPCPIACPPVFGQPSSRPSWNIVIRNSWRKSRFVVQWKWWILCEEVTEIPRLICLANLNLKKAFICLL